MINCPRCGSKSVPIAYGLILPSAASDRGELVLGGCEIIDGFDPDRQCTSCKWSFWADDIDRAPLPPKESFLGI